MTLPAHDQPQGARHSTSLVTTSYLGPSGRLMFNPEKRGEVHSTVRQWLRVARTPADIAGVMRVWRQVHYLARPDKGPHWDPIGREQIRIHYFLDLPALRVPPVSWYPAAAVTVKYCAAVNSGPWQSLGLESPLQCLEIARNFVADDIRLIRDMSPTILREVVRRIREGSDWATVVNGRVQWEPQWLLSFSDPDAGHDGGLYRGAGAVYLGQRVQGTDCWGWPLTDAARGLGIRGGEPCE